jgi:hypothetical protein
MILFYAFVQESADALPWFRMIEHLGECHSLPGQR